MKSTVTAALTSLRDADPARTVAAVDAPYDAWLMRHGLRPDSLAPAGSPVRASRRRRVALVGAAVVSVAAVVIAVVAFDQVSDGRGSRTPISQAASPTASGSRGAIPLPSAQWSPSSGFPSFGPTGTLGTSDDPNFAPALQRIESALATVAMLPGAVRVDQPPTTDLKGPATYSADMNYIDRATLWTAAGTQADGIAFFKANPPPGTTYDGASSVGNTKTNVALHEQTLMYVTANSAGNAVAVDFQITVVAYGAGVAVRVDASTIFAATKAADEYIGPVDSVDVVVHRDNQSESVGGRTIGAPDVERTLSGASAQRLADAIDAAAIDTGGPRSCPMSFGFTDTMTFHAHDGRQIIATQAVNGCAGIDLTINDIAMPPLRGSVDDQLMDALGLPDHYGG